MPACLNNYIMVKFPGEVCVTLAEFRGSNIHLRANFVSYGLIVRCLVLCARYSKALSSQQLL